MTQQADKGGCTPLVHPSTKTGIYLSNPLISKDLCMGQKMGSIFRPRQTLRPEGQPGTSPSTGSTGYQMYHNGGTGFQQKEGAAGDQSGDVAIWRTFHTSPMPGHSADYGVRTDHKQTEYLNGKLAYEQRPAMAEFQPQKEGRHRDEDYIKQLRAHIDRLENENGSLKHDLKVTESELADTRNLSQIRAEELQGAQAFLDKADVLSTTDIVKMVNILNSEISQTASLLVDLLHNAESHHRTQRQPTEMTNWMLGEKLARDLYELSNNPTAMNSRLRETNNWQLLFLVVFHIAITKWCSMMVNSWVPNDHTLSDSISSIYSGIRKIKDQAVCGRWRSIMREQLRLSSPSNENQLVALLLSAITSDILHIAGLSIQDAERQQLERRLLPLSKAVNKLREPIGEGITSVDLEVNTIETGHPFDPRYMEESNDFKGGKSPPSGGVNFDVTSSERVVGATELGLCAKRGRMNGHEIILLPKVALEGVLKEAGIVPRPITTTPPRRTSTLTRRNTTGSHPVTTGTASSRVVYPPDHEFSSMLS